MRLILVKHAMPVLAKGVPPAQWELSDDGRRAAAALGRELAAFAVTRVVSSAEPKARETAREIAAQLAVPFSEQADLHEHERGIVKIEAAEVFREQVRALFERPDELVYGLETARAAAERFGRAVDHALAAHTAGDLAIVAHGTVIALFVAQRAGVDGFGLWQRLGLPSCVVLALPEYAVVEVSG